MSKIGVLLPAYNEEKNIKRVIEGVRKKLVSPEIIVVDDGSTDRTYEIARKAGVTVLKHEKNKGKGEALNTGFNYFLEKNPEVEIIAIADVDGQYLTDEIHRIIEPLEKGEADLVMGYRNWKEVPYANALGNFIWRVFFNFFFGTNFKDTNCGYLGLTKETIRKIGKIRGGYIIENALLRDAVMNRIKIEQVPVSVKYGKRKILHFARMFLGILIFILMEGIKYRLKKI